MCGEPRWHLDRLRQRRQHAQDLGGGFGHRTGRACPQRSGDGGGGRPIDTSGGLRRPRWRCALRPPRWALLGSAANHRHRPRGRPKGPLPGLPRTVWRRSLFVGVRHHLPPASLWHQPAHQPVRATATTSVDNWASTWTPHGRYTIHSDPARPRSMVNRAIGTRRPEVCAKGTLLDCGRAPTWMLRGASLTRQGCAPCRIVISRTAGMDSATTTHNSTGRTASVPLRLNPTDSAPNDSLDVCRCSVRHVGSAAR